MKKQQKFLVIVDQSYFLYYIIYGAVAEFGRKFPQLAQHWIKPAEEVDQQNLPDLTACQEFTRTLRKFVMKRLETIDWLTKQHFQQELDMSVRIDILFADDDYVSNSFRKKLYPAYKAQRKISKKSYDVFKIRNYITNVIFKDLDVYKDYNFLRVDGAEGDDVIACILKNFKDEYETIVLFASDHDFLQIDGVHQLDLFGKEAKRQVAGIDVTADEYLLTKILIGDGADNIGKVFSGVGPKKALKLVRDKDSLKAKLKESQDAAKQYLLNKKLISFKEIPKELEDKIVKEAHEKLFKNDVLNAESTDLASFMTL